jgi:hypothetical protein
MMRLLDMMIFGVPMLLFVIIAGYLIWRGRHRSGRGLWWEL